MPEVVAILGASDKPERYAYQAQVMLQEHNHTVIPVNPRLDTIHGVSCAKSLADCTQSLDTVTVYVGPKILAGLVDDLIAVHPRRIILNPGTEDEAIEKQLSNAGIFVERACTLVLLRTNQYDMD